ncbi:tRNA nucleotidyltransferase [Porphyromonadaceae bacterium COT-184 OH4590]|nr:tRNA nucleotidyltransferase [Porphyromonadaceae bacterium COT-184 OH4590]MDO4726128.1 HD domain-containing protein [Porphyromonadaceae bacterium]
MNLISKIDTKIFHTIGNLADELGLECYLIGGYVRDLLLDRGSKDIDVVVVGNGVAFAEALKKRLGRGAQLAVFKTYGTAQLKHYNTEIEIVGARKESYSHNSRNPIVEQGSLEDDQNRRDFTINALAICLNSKCFGELIDPFGGLNDLETKTIKTPLDPDITFSDDPLRMMRAIRFATQLGFNIKDETLVAIWRNRDRIKIITKERISDELNKIILAPKPSVGFYLLDKTGLLPLIFPELSAMKGIDTINGRAHKDNFVHSLQVLDNIALRSNDLWLRWATLLHDIGKPNTKRWEEGRGWTFHNHNYVGSKMVKRIFESLKLPLGEPLKFVQKMVLLHMRPIVLSEDIVTDSAVRRLLFDAGNDIDSLMMLCQSDITSNNMKKVKRFSENFELVRRKLVELEEKDRIRNFQPPVDGDEIMATFGLPPSAVVGELKAEIKDAILDGIIPNSHNEAFDYLLKIAKERGLEPTK